MPTKSVQELYEDGKNEIQNQDPTLTDFNDGSLLDIVNGLISTAVAEVQRHAVDQFKKTFTTTADGPEVTLGDDDLQYLFVDHFGDEFARPLPNEATGQVTFTRPTDDAGDCTIPAGTVVKTLPNSSGVAQRFETESEVIITALTINASVVALVAGTDGNVEAEEITVLESTLTDTTITVSNEDPMAGGTEIATDSEYREFVRNLLISVRGGTLESIEAAAKAVPGIEYAVGQEKEQTVIEWDEFSHLASGDPFRIARVRLYVGDANGEASDALLDEVEEALEPIRACGVRITIFSAIAIELDLTFSLALDLGGPNYAELSADPQLLIDEITDYINDLAIGDDFIVADLEAEILAGWGPSGSGDLTAFAVETPIGDVTTDPQEKILPGTIEVA